MKTRLASCLVFLLVTIGLRAGDVSSDQSPGSAPDQAEQPTPATILASQVGEIASSSSLSRKTKEERITSAVRLAVIAATADVKDPEQALTIALGLATAAAKAAPDFATVIRDAILSIPSIAAIDGALAQLQKAVLDGVTAAANERHEANAASSPPRPPPNPEFGGSTGQVVVSPYR